MVGLSAPQAALSGSNYAYEADGVGCIGETTDSAAAISTIGAGDRFAVVLDYGFVRYLQAVDPYVLIYSESWMGSDPPPNDGEKHRQVVLLKEGLSQNARLPIGNYPVLGPVTLGDDKLPATITIKVIVLSKYDNKETIALIDQLAAAAAVAQPQYAAAANAAGAIAAAVISRNRDKVEFEHTLTFWPEGTILPPGSDGHRSHSLLRPVRVAIFKGESEYRNVPYETWYYYAWPFNWFGHSTAPASRRDEAEPSWAYCRTCPSDLTVIPWFLGCLVRVPFYALGDIFVAGQLDTGHATPIDCLEVGPQQISDVGGCVAKKRTGCSPRFGIPYAERTHVVLSVRRTAGTYGDFSTFATKFSKQAVIVNEVITDRASWESESSGRLRAAFDAVRSMTVAESARDAAMAAVDAYVDQSQQDFKATGLTCAEREQLVSATIAKQKRVTIDRYLEYAASYLKQAADQTEKDAVLDKVAAFIDAHRWSNTPGTNVGAWDCAWSKAWSQVLDETAARVKVMQPTASNWTTPPGGFGPPGVCDSSNWKKCDDRTSEPG